MRTDCAGRLKLLFRVLFGSEKVQGVGMFKNFQKKFRHNDVITF